MIATVSIFFDPRGLPDGRHSVKWLVTHQRKRRMFSAGKILSKDDVRFLKQYAGGLKGAVKDEDKRNLWKDIYEGVLGRARSIIDLLGTSFSFESFREMSKGTLQTEEKVSGLPDNAFDWFKAEILANKEEKRNGNAQAFESAEASFRRFLQSMTTRQRLQYRVGSPDVLPFRSITVEFLNRYEQWMLEKGKLGQQKKGDVPREEMPASKTTIGMYTRALRRIYNLQKFTGPDDYPFAGKNYKIPGGRNIKKALPSDQLASLLAYDPLRRYLKPGQEEKDLTPRVKQLVDWRRQAYDLWVFSYLSNGVNMADILKISKKMLVSDKIKFIRQKTARTTKENQTEVVIRLLPRSKEIIDRWWNSKDKSPDSSIWSFLEGVNIRDIDVMERQTNNIIGSTNDQMKKIAAELGIEGDVRTYAARHSFATTLLRSGVPIGFISASLGNKLISTQSYLGSFEDEQADEYLKALIPGEKK